MQQQRASLLHSARQWLAIAAATTAAIASPAIAWERAHSVGSNTGYADVDTIPAKKAPVTVPNIGSFAPGAGPVIAPDGTVYLGNEQGKLIALRADGSAYWSRDISPGYAITASPLVAPNGYVYVIGTTKYTDHRVNPPAHVVKSQLNIFTPGGGWVGPFPFPDHNGPGAAYGPPNLWRFGGQDVVMATATYRNQVTGGYETRLIAFSTSGPVLGDQRVATVVQTVSGSYECPFGHGFFCPGFEHGSLGVTVTPPGLGIFTFQGGGTPHIVVSDGLKDLVGYTFDGTSLIEHWRVHDDNYFLRSTPTMLPDGHTIIGVEQIDHEDGQEVGSGAGALLFAGPNMSALPRVDGVGSVYTAPSVTRDGRAILVDGDGQLIVLQGTQVVSKIGIARGSVASAAVSRTHVFVSTDDAFLTYDVSNMAEVGRINWVGGGKSSPAIGPKGQVYAVANNILFVFSGPRRAIDPGIVTDAPQAVVTTDPPPSTQPASQHFSGPVTPGGYRLFACLELDGDDCGKSTNEQVALAFCQQKGFAQVDKVDTETKKVKAARLDGQFCTKHKCEVFDEITCKN